MHVTLLVATINLNDTSSFVLNTAHDLTDINQERKMAGVILKFSSGPPTGPIFPFIWKMSKFISRQMKMYLFQIFKLWTTTLVGCR